jgi:hypothetical protein
LVLGLTPAAPAEADEPRRTLDMSRVFDSGASRPRTPMTSTPADPPPLSERRQWLFDFRWDRGEVWLLGAGATDEQTPRETARAMGRFALELYEGPALIERVRFDFPLLGAAEALDGRGDRPPSLSQKLRTRVAVMFPATTRGTRLELWDRASDLRWSLPWPPLEARPRSRDAGAEGG